MALWGIRTGKHGEYEQRFLGDQRIYLTWNGFDRDLAKFAAQSALAEAIQQVYPDASPGRAKNNAAQMWAFAKRMEKGDWVVVPSKLKSAIHVAEITGAYRFDATADDPYYHSRDVKWVAQNIPRSIFDQDLLYSFGAIQTVFGVSRNNAEQRVRAMAKTGWTPSGTTANVNGVESAGEEDVDLEDAARDQIAKLIIKRYKGHDLERLVEAVLQAQGYTTYRSPIGPDKGVDLLAAPGPLGFGHPRICVQVKSGDTPVDAPTLNQLIGTMQNVQADQGLLVSWGGFKSSVDKEVPAQFFRVRLWDQKTLVDQVLHHYNELDADLRAEIPLKRIWVISQTADTE
jgi:restriction system protein